jgi:hypothetical protein
MNQQSSSQGILQSLTSLLQPSGSPQRNQASSIQVPKYQNETIYQQRYSPLQPSPLRRRKQSIEANGWDPAARLPQERQGNRRQSSGSELVPSIVNGFNKLPTTGLNGWSSDNPFKLRTASHGTAFQQSSPSMATESLLSSLFESSREIKQQNDSVANVVNGISASLNTILHMSYQEKDAFSELAKRIDITHETTNFTNEMFTEKFLQLSNTLDEQSQTQHYIQNTIELIVDHSADIINKIDSIEKEIKNCLIKETSKDASSVPEPTNFISSPGAASNNTLFHELMRFSESIGHQQQNINDLLLGIREYFDSSVGDMHRLKESISLLVREEATDASSELRNTFKKANERTYEQLQILGRDIVDLHNSLQETISNSPRALNQNKEEIRASIHDHLIPEILNRLVALEQESRYRHDKSFTSLVEFIAIQLEQLSKENRTHMEDVAKFVSATSESRSPTIDLTGNKFEVNNYELLTAEKRIKDLELQVEQSKTQQENETAHHEQKVADLESKIRKLEFKLRQKCEEGSTSFDSKLNEELKQRLAKNEDRLHEAEATNRVMKDEMRLLKYLNNDIGRHEETIANLEGNIDQLRSEKDILNVELGSLNTVYDMRVSQLHQLETRITAFEQRLNQVSLERLKTILGSTTMAIINSSSADQSKSNHGVESLTDTSETKKSKRHLSLAQTAFNPPDDSANKENGVLKMNVLEGHVKQRSISLFSDL